MKCPHCNQEHPDGYQFCPAMGKKIEKMKACTNPDCPDFEKYVLPLDSLFCPTCGTRLATTTNKEEYRPNRKIIIRRNTSSMYDDWLLLCYIDSKSHKLCTLNRTSEYYPLSIGPDGIKDFTLIVDGKHKTKNNANFGKEHKINVPEDYDGEISITWDWWNGLQIKLVN